MQRKTVVLFTIFILFCSLEYGKTFSISGQAKMILKITSYDKGIANRISDNIIKIGLISPLSNPEMVSKTDEVKKTLLKFKKVKISGHHFDVVKFNFETPGTLESFLTQNKINVLYIMSGDDANLGTISKLCRRYKIFSITNSKRYVEKGLSIGFEINSKGKLEIYSNKKSIKAEQLTLASGLLMISKVLEGN